MSTQKACKNCGKSYEVESDDLKFYKKISPTFNGETFDIPVPGLCPMCRKQRRYAFRNERTLHKRTCDFSKKNIISIYSQDKPHKVYEKNLWWSDNWDPMDYGRDVDFSRPFFDQLKELIEEVPKMSCVQQGDNENSEYTNCASYNKNCYLVYSSNRNEDCLYSKWINESTDCIDNYNVQQCELTHQSIDCFKCYDIQYCQYVHNSSTARHSFDCRNCQNIFACVGLRNKQYHVLNKKVSKEKFEELLKNKTKQKEILGKFNELYLSTPRVYSIFLNSENFSGSNITNCKNVHFCTDVLNLEDCKYCDNYEFAKDSHDVSFYGCTSTNELNYEVEGSGHGIVSVLFSKMVWGGSSNVYYSYECFNSHNLFGCAGLKKAKYSILNKQYSEENYDKMVAKVIKHMIKNGEWGEFFPVKLSPFGYNETLANEQFRLTRKEALERGYKWKDSDPREYIKQTYDIPKNIQDLPDSIVSEILSCTDCRKNYRIVPKELQFYKKLDIDIPTKCPDCRHLKRVKMRPSGQLYDRKCDKCGADIQTVYSPDRPEIVYCEKCYLNTLQ